MVQLIRLGKGNIRVALLLLLAGIGLISCRQNALNDISPADSQVYITNRDRAVDFSQYKTFSLPDSVIVQSNDSYDAVKNSIADQFVSSVASALTAKGYQRVDKGKPADLGVAIIRVNNQYTGIASNPYSYYSSYWGGGYGGYSPYSPSYYTYQVTEQYWEIQMVDLKNVPTNTGTAKPELRVIYDASIRGGDITDTQSVATAVNAIFNQSPYLRAVQ